VRVNCVNGELGFLERLRILVRRLLEQNAEASLEVDGQAGGVLATNVETVGELECSRLHEH